MRPKLTVEVYGETHDVMLDGYGNPIVSRLANPEYRWRIKHRNGRIMADSGEGYKRKRDCLKAIATLKAGFAKAEVVEK